MSSLDVIPSSNGRGSDAWSASWMRFTIDRPSPGHCRVTFDNPPINAITATTVAELSELVGLIEHDSDLNVVVFDSANPDVYLGADPLEMPAWTEVLDHLAHAPVLTVASIRGRASGEFVLACDLRFASRENTMLGPFERGTGRLSRLVGPSRALEILLIDDTFDGPRAQQYGLVNRAIADERLDAEVAAIAARLARGDHKSVARTKAWIDSGWGQFGV